MEDRHSETSPPDRAGEHTETTETTETISLDEIESRLVELLSEIIGIDRREIDRRASLIGYGIDSMDAVVLAGEMSEWLGVDDIDPTIVWDFPTIDAVAGYLHRLINAQPQVPQAASVR